MADIFISYSSKDREQALQLIELLSSAGLSVWIDKSGIDVATSWSKEIVQAIDSCKALVVLLSPHSVVSVNVAKEVSLAAEQKKKILPLDLEPVELTDDLRYHLAGIQRAPMANIDAIIRAIGKLGLEATQAPTMKLVKEKDSRKSLMILPFEDLSPTGDNGWFADGIANELIAALSHIKALRVADKQATKDYKRYQGTLPNYAKEMSIRYFIQGDVRKFGDQIKITSSLLDIESGDHLWQDSLKGTMDDIFDIQEKVAEKVVEGLKIHLASDEKKKLAERGTENVEAYELYMKAREYAGRQTREGFDLSAQLSEEAFRLDPSYVQAYLQKASMLINRFRAYDRTSALLDEAEKLCDEARKQNPEHFGIYDVSINILVHRGNYGAAEELAKEWIVREPRNPNSHFSLAFFYTQIERLPEAIASYEAVLELDPNFYTALINMIIACDAVGDTDKCGKWARIGLEVIERYVRLHPDDEERRSHRPLLLHFTGKDSEALAAARELTDERSLRQIRDGATLYNIAYLMGSLGAPQEALSIFRRSIEAGFRATKHLQDFLFEEKNRLATLSGTPEYEEVKRIVENIVRETEAKKNG